MQRRWALVRLRVLNRVHGLSREGVRVDSMSEHGVLKFLRVEVDARSRLVGNQLWDQSRIFQKKVRDEIRLPTLEGEISEETRLVHLVVSNADFPVESGSRTGGVEHNGRVDGRPQRRRGGDHGRTNMSLRGELVLLCVQGEMSA